MERSSSLYVAILPLGDHRHCGGEDILFLIYHVTLCDHVFKGLRDFNGRSF